MPDIQTSLTAGTFGDELQQRLNRAEAIIDRAHECYQRLFDEIGDAWQLMVIDEAALDAARAYQNAQDTDRYEQYIEAAEYGIESAETAVNDILSDYESDVGG